jgi:hypothetical protein
MRPSPAHSEPFQTAKLKLVTIIGEASQEIAVLSLLNGSGASGYTTTRASGFGSHGSSRPGLIDAGNIRVEVLLPPAAARVLLEKVLLRFAGQRLIAFMVDAEAIPAEHFAR